MIPSITTGFKTLSIDQITDFKLIEGNIRFLKKSQEILTLTEIDGELHPVKIYCYHRKMDFNFHVHGFQFCTLDSKVVGFAREFLTSPLGTVGRQNKQHMLNWADQFLGAWGKENGIQGKAACVDFHYRTTEPYTSARGAFHFAHVDYEKGSLANTMQVLKNLWKSNIDRANKGVLDPLSEETYRNLKIHAMVNLWMPLNELPTANTLALMDISSSENIFDELRPALTPGPITSLSLEAGAHQKWVAVTERFGNGVIFNTLGTPHSGVNIPGWVQEQVHDEFRRSLEFRILYYDFPD